MARYTLNREFYIPKGTTPIADPQSDAIAYVGKDAKGRPIAAMFFGKQAKPVWYSVFRSQASLEAEVKRAIEGRRATVAYKAKAAAERKAQVNPWQVGSIAYVSWGYEQTNTSAYQCVEVRGMIAFFRAVACESVGETSSMSGYVKPVRDSFRGEPIRVMAKGGGKIDGHHLSAWDGERKLYWSSYA